MKLYLIEDGEKVVITSLVSALGNRSLFSYLFYRTIGNKKLFYDVETIFVLNIFN